jgi:hypothetical protein
MFGPEFNGYGMRLRGEESAHESQELGPMTDVAGDGQEHWTCDNDISLLIPAAPAALFLFVVS